LQKAGAGSASTYQLCNGAARRSRHLAVTVSVAATLALATTSPSATARAHLNIAHLGSRCACRWQTLASSALARIASGDVEHRALAAGAVISSAAARTRKRGTAAACHTPISHQYKRAISGGSMAAASASGNSVATRILAASWRKRK